MSNIELFNPGGGSLSNRSSRSLSRALADVHAGSAVQVARIEAAVARHESVVDGVTAIAGAAMRHVAMVSQAEQQLAQAVPMASGRLAAVADMHALAMTGIVMDAARALGRMA